MFKLSIQQSIYEFIYGGEIRLVMEAEWMNKTEDGMCSNQSYTLEG